MTSQQNEGRSRSIHISFLSFNSFIWSMVCVRVSLSLCVEPFFFHFGICQTTKSKWLIEFFRLKFRNHVLKYHNNYICLYRVLSTSSLNVYRLQLKLLVRSPLWMVAQYIRLEKAECRSTQRERARAAANNNSNNTKCQVEQPTMSEAVFTIWLLALNYV